MLKTARLPGSHYGVSCALLKPLHATVIGMFGVPTASVSRSMNLLGIVVEFLPQLLLLEDIGES